MTAEYARLAPTWAASTAPLPVLRLGAGRHRAPGGRAVRRWQRATLAVRRQVAAAAVLAVVHLSSPGVPS